MVVYQVGHIEYFVTLNDLGGNLAFYLQSVHCRFLHCIDLVGGMVLRLRWDRHLDRERWRPFGRIGGLVEGLGFGKRGCCH